MRRISIWLLGVAVTGWTLVARAGDEGGQKQPGPPTKMEIVEVFPTQGNTYVAIKFYDAKEQPTRVSSGVFEYWSNFLLDKRAPAKKRRLPVGDKRVMEHNFKYTLKLPGFGKLCPPRVAKLRITFRSQSPKVRLRKTWTKKAKCR